MHRIPQEQYTKTVSIGCLHRRELVSGRGVKRRLLIIHIFVPFMFIKGKQKVNYLIFNIYKGKLSKNIKLHEKLLLYNVTE